MKLKSVYICQNCGYNSPRWLGKCPECQQWNTFQEEVVEAKQSKTKKSEVAAKSAEIALISDIISNDYERTKTNLDELDRVLGGGLVKGSVLLIGGDPGIGKSTLMLQIANNIKDKKFLYVSGEESSFQIKLRSDRLKYHLNNFYVVSETNLEIVESVVENEKPEILVIDSIQTIYDPKLESASGTVSQLRDCTSALIKLAKSKGIIVFIVGHITKEGMIAGPKVLEHMVDVVLQFEGERTHSYRILRGIKNRFGSTNEIGIFEMTDTGLKEVLNPSEVFLSQRNYGASGCIISCSIEGSRPILIEVQGLVTSTNYGMPQRTASGFDYKRLNLLVAVLEKKLGLFLNKSDIFVNIAGGVKIDEPAIDLAIAMSIYSSSRDIPLDSETVVLGEIGLSGEIRTISYIDKRINEAAKLGFKKIIIPKGNLKNINTKNSKIDIVPVENIRNAIELLV
ncbi:MAG TPA: DNA repair protein RadA [Ignavibacteria bacterium]|nr:DNA repair protein RadA [Ignavibacteria bacterium]